MGEPERAKMAAKPPIFASDIKIGKLLVACEGYEPKKMQSSANIIETQ